MQDSPSLIEIILAQGALRQCGYYHGLLDGNSGRSARQALMGFQKDNGIEATGEFDDELFRTPLAWREEKAYATDG
jgi:peptidoglycan hydrolase-like protein with peptidoglycan-binding domain